MSNVVKHKHKYNLDYKLKPDQYITDVIPDDVIKHWRYGDQILINSNTGTGKTYFIMTKVYRLLHDAFEEKGTRKLLYVTNRDALKQQLIELYGNDEVNQMVTFINYQGLSKLIDFREYKIKDQYDVIIIDECHSFFTDSSFVENTDIPLKFAAENCDKSIVIYLSATSKVVEDYFAKHYPDKITYKYKLIKPYQFQQYFYWDNIDVIQKFLSELPEDEKAIYFCGNINRALELYSVFKNNSSFVCSLTGRYKDKCNAQTLEIIQKEQRFNQQILFATSVLENGVNICDPALKHIIIDMVDFDSIIQSIGRKRLQAGEELPILYMRQHKQAAIQTKINVINKKLEPYNYFQEHSHELFCKSYRDKKLHVLYTVSQDNLFNYVVNEARLYKLNYDLEIYSKINKGDTKLGHIKEFCKYIGFNFRDFQDLSIYFTEITLIDKLNMYVGKKLYEQEKTNFIELLKKEVLKPLKGGYKADTVNKYFNNIELPFYVTTKLQGSRNNPHYGKRAWILKRKNN